MWGGIRLRGRLGESERKWGEGEGRLRGGDGWVDGEGKVGGRG